MHIQTRKIEKKEKAKQNEWGLELSDKWVAFLEATKRKVSYTREVSGTYKKKR